MLQSPGTSIGLGLLGIGVVAASALSLRAAFKYCAPYLERNFRHLELANGTIFTQTELNTQMLTTLGKEVGKIQDSINLLIDQLEDVKAGLVSEGHTAAAAAAAGNNGNNSLREETWSRDDLADAEPQNQPRQPPVGSNNEAPGRSFSSTTLSMPADNSERIFRQFQKAHEKVRVLVQKRIEDLEAEEKSASASASAKTQPATAAPSSSSSAPLPKSSKGPSSSPSSGTYSGATNLFASLTQSFTSTGKSSGSFFASSPPSPTTETKAFVDPFLPPPSNTASPPSKNSSETPSASLLALVPLRGSGAIPDILNLTKYITSFVKSGLFSVFHSIII